ncbi:MAG: glycerate kinase [Spirochaetales bacterium]|nr:glycerate kinase [Spirochaetales bacterium]
MKEAITKAMDIFKAGLLAVSPEKAVMNHLSVKNNTLAAGGLKIALSGFKQIYVLGAGKASAHMARALELLLEKQSLPWLGHVVVKDGHSVPLRHIKITEAAHPVPDYRGLEASESILSDLQNCGEETLVVSLMSGGGSSLLPCPAGALTLDDLKRATDLLLASGAGIHEINSVRKHLSRVKGGLLARAAFPARVVNLMLSDVIGDSPGVIASGPFSADISTFETALAVIRNYGLEASMPHNLLEHLNTGARGLLDETPKPGDPCFDRVDEWIIASNSLFLSEAQARAGKWGYHSMILSSSFSGEASQFAQLFLSVAREIAASGQPFQRPACLLAGGELTVTVKGNGLGGRNQEAALAAVKNIAEIPGALFFSAGTDGTDGPTDAAGAWCETNTLAKAKAAGLNPYDFLERNDSYHFFEPLNQLVRTGPTGTNVMDCYMLLID